MGLRVGDKKFQSCRMRLPSRCHLLLDGACVFVRGHMQLSFSYINEVQPFLRTILWTLSVSHCKNEPSMLDRLSQSEHFKYTQAADVTLSSFHIFFYLSPGNLPSNIFSIWNTFPSHVRGSR